MSACYTVVRFSALSIDWVYFYLIAGVHTGFGFGGGIPQAVAG
jgi:hypothetical protein